MRWFYTDNDDNAQALQAFMALSQALSRSEQGLAPFICPPRLCVVFFATFPLKPNRRIAITDSTGRVAFHLGFRGEWPVVGHQQSKFLAISWPCVIGIGADLAIPGKKAGGWPHGLGYIRPVSPCRASCRPFRSSPASQLLRLSSTLLHHIRIDFSGT